MEASRVTTEFPEINNVWLNTTLVGSRDLQLEKIRAGERRLIVVGLATQKVFLRADGNLIISEAMFEDDGAFMKEVTVIDPIAESAVAWRGRAVNNRHGTGVWRPLDDEAYQSASVKAAELVENHPVVARTEQASETS